MILSVDPDVRAPGCALWTDEAKLVAAGIAKSTIEEGSGPGECSAAAHAVAAWVETVCIRRGHTRLELHNFPYITTYCVEFPQIYQREANKTKADPNVLLPIAGVAAAIAVLFPQAKVKYCTPHDWKGNVGKPKTVKEPYPIEARVRERLAPEELSVIDWPKSKNAGYDVTDGIGVGLYLLGRFSPIRRFARE